MPTLMLDNNSDNDATAQVHRPKFAIWPKSQKNDR